MKFIMYDDKNKLENEQTKLQEQVFNIDDD